MLFFEQGQLDKKEEIGFWEKLYTSPILRGSLLGGTITAFVSWNNSGGVGRIGTFWKRWRFIRFLVSPKPQKAFCPITNYHHANLDIAANNFFCYSGESGIGVSNHFEQLISKQSYKRPTLYVDFKAVGREANFENDLSQQLNHGILGKGGIVGQIVKAIKKIHQISSNPKAFLFKYYLTHCLFLGIYGAAFSLDLSAQVAVLIASYSCMAQYYFWRFMIPLVRQVKRGTIPVLVFDDLNKLQHLGMLAQITRLFKVVEAKAANIILISSNQETWSKLRREPGMKDRLRVRHIKYDHAYTAEKLIELIATDPKLVSTFFTAYPLITHTLLKQMARVFIGERQMSLRRFSSVLKLVGEEDYQKLVEILKNQEQLTPEDIVEKMRLVIFQSEVQTIVTKFRSIKRQLQSMSQQQYIDTLEMVVRNKKLPSDSKVGSLLKVYNILRDLRSEYVINGGYMLNIFELALQQYKKEWRAYQASVNSRKG